MASLGKISQQIKLLHLFRLLCVYDSSWFWKYIYSELAWEGMGVELKLLMFGRRKPEKSPWSLWIPCVAVLMKQRLVLNLFVGYYLRDFSFNFDLSTERTISKNKISIDSVQQRSPYSQNTWENHISFNVIRIK